MMDSLYLRVIQDVSKQQYELDEIFSKFYRENLEDLLEYLYDTFKDVCIDMVNSDQYIDNYHNFLFNLTDAINESESLDLLAVCIRRHIDVVKELIKPYNKKEKDKDDTYTNLTRLKQKLETNYNNALNKSANLYEDDNTKVLKFVIFDLKDLDELYHVIDTHKEIVNVYIQEEHLLHYIIRYYLQNIDDLTHDDRDYFKRVMEMIFIRKELNIEEKEFVDIMKELDYKISKEDDNLKEYKHLKYRIDNHYKILSRDNTIVNEFKTPIIPEYFPINGPVHDLRNMTTFTIDYVKYAKNFKGLYDDAISMKANPNGTYFMYLHTPDVDEYIPRDKYFDNYMRGKYETSYGKNKTDPMIPYQIASRMSLVKGQDRYALTTRIHVDENGNILDVKYMRSIIRVDDNLSINKANVLLNNYYYEYNWLLDMMYSVCKQLRLNRDEYGKRGKASTISDEFNIWTNIATADFFKENGLPFAFKNYVVDDHKSKHLGAVRDFLANNKVEEEAREILYSLFESEGRTTYSTTCLGNSKFNGLPYANVGNPLREYMSLETDRLIRDLIIDQKNNLDYWQERIETDCIEQSEGVQKVKELYKTIS